MTTPPRVLGLDLSLTSTGIASCTGWADTLKPPAKLRGHDRLRWLLTAVADHTRLADLVVVEGPSYGSQAGQAGHHERAGLWWLTTHQLWTREVPVAVAPPSCVKRYATGKGNASKDAVLSAVVRRFAWFGEGNDAADAVILAALGADQVGAPMVAMPKEHRAALGGVAWPDNLPAPGACRVCGAPFLRLLAPGVDPICQTCWSGEMADDDLARLAAADLATEAA